MAHGAGRGLHASVLASPSHLSVEEVGLILVPDVSEDAVKGVKVYEPINRIDEHCNEPVLNEHHLEVLDQKD